MTFTAMFEERLYINDDGKIPFFNLMMQQLLRIDDIKGRNIESEFEPAIENLEMLGSGWRLEYILSMAIIL